MENSFRLRARKMIAAAASVALAASLCAVPATAHADDSTEAALAKVNELMGQINSANDDYRKALSEKDAAQKKVKKAQKTIKEESAKIDKNQTKLSSRMRTMYRDGQSTFLDVMLGSASFDAFIQNWDLLSGMNEDDAALITDLKASRQKVETAKDEAQKNADTAAQKAKDAKQRRDQANELAKEAQAEYQAAYAAAQNFQNIANAGNATQDTTQQTTVPKDQITNFNNDTGEVTMADGSKGRVVGYDPKTGNAIVDMAMSYVGGKYGWGAQDAKNRTFDCSGLVQYVYQQNGINVGGHNDRAILNAGKVVKNPKAGDILWWDGHVAIYAGNGMMVSADNKKNGITYRKVDKGATYVRY